MKKACLFYSCGVLALVLLVALGTWRPVGASTLAAQQAAGRALIVTSPADEGPGTFRQALLEAQPGDTITFDPLVFPPEDPTTITVLSGLPGLAQGQVTIDASHAGVILDGSRLPREGQAPGLDITSSGNRILGLQILHFAGGGLLIVDGGNNEIGGAGPGEGNVLSGNWDGINLIGSGARDNVIRGNYFGTDASGTVALGNHADGVWIGRGAQYNLVGGATAAERNLLSGNGSSGVVIDGGLHNTVSGNYIGTDVTGARALGNRSLGVVLAGGAQYNRIGGDAPGDRNVISGNEGGGLYAGQADTRFNTVSGNYIGTDASGTEALPNGWSGINLIEGTRDNLIGGAAPGEGNLISGNHGDGVTLGGPGVSNNGVTGNRIGVDATGEAPLGNEQHGVGIVDGAGPNTIGPGNTIAYNSLSGVRVGEGTEGNTITANAIYDNGDAGIEVDEGANAGIAPPEITSLSSRVIKGSAPPGATIEVYYDEGDEGRVLAGSTTADVGGAFAYTVPAGAFVGPHVLVTATDGQGNTSSFSTPWSPPTPAVIRELPDIVAPAQVSTDLKVIGTNLGLALFCVLFFGLTSTVFNSILEDYRDEIVGGLARLVPRAWAERLRGADRSLGQMVAGGQGRLLLTWLVVLLVTALIESFLDPTIGIVGLERLGLLLTLFLSAVVVSGLELASGLVAHRRWAPATRRELQVQWVGLALAIACVILSRALRFTPGYLYGIVGAVYLTPKLAGTAAPGKRALLVLSAVLAGSLVLWIVSAFLPPALAALESVLLTAFLIGLQGVFFQLFPLAVTDGGDLWSWRKGLWFAVFLVVFFCTYHFVLNPNGSDVQALQQNGVQTLAVLMGVFGLATALLWLLLPFRLRRRAR
jgi:hypothetical protein